MGLPWADLQVDTVLGTPFSHAVRRPGSVLIHLQNVHWTEISDPSTFQLLDELLRLLTASKVSCCKKSGGAVGDHQHWLLLSLSWNDHSESVSLNSMVELHVLGHTGDRNARRASVQIAQPTLMLLGRFDQGARGVLVLKQSHQLLLCGMPKVPVQSKHRSLSLLPIFVM